MDVLDRDVVAEDVDAANTVLAAADRDGRPRSGLEHDVVLRRLRRVDGNDLRVVVTGGGLDHLSRLGDEIGVGERPAGVGLGAVLAVGAGR